MYILYMYIDHDFERQVRAYGMQEELEGGKGREKEL